MVPIARRLGNVVLRRFISPLRIKRVFDIMFSVFLLTLAAVPMLLIAAAVKLTSRGPVIHRSWRIGKDNRRFRMPKFRTMKIETPDVATHLFTDAAGFMTPVGAFLRKTSLDELPQLYSILKGDMSFVGPRPALHNQHDLEALRTARGIHKLVPGLTGWAQVNGRDDLPIPVKVDFDEQYLRDRSFLFDLRILCMTLQKVFLREGVKH